MLLAALGGAAGLLFAPLCLRALMAYLPQGSPTSLDVTPDARVLAFTLIVSAATALLFGLLPAWQATRVDPIGAMKDQTGASAGRSRLTLNKSLVVTQVALSLFLLVGAGLFVRSLRNLRTLDAGIDYRNIVQFSLDTGASFDAARRTSLYKQLLTRLEALPGVQSATLLYFSLLGNGSVSYTITAPGAAPRADDNCYLMEVGPRYFETMKMPILVGRAFGPQDERPMAESERPAVMRPGYLAGAPPLDAVVNQAMARHFFGVENAVGERFVQQGTGQRYNVIGVTNDAKYRESARSCAAHLLPLSLSAVAPNPDDAPVSRQRRDRRLRSGDSAAGARGRTPGAADQRAADERRGRRIAGAGTLHRPDRQRLQPVRPVAGLRGPVQRDVVHRHAADQRDRHPHGPRRRAADVVRLVMREVGLLMALGIGAGLGVALAVTRLATLFTLLFDLAPTDPATIALATLLLAGVAALAGYLPARRASRVDPLRCAQVRIARHVRRAP